MKNAPWAGRFKDFNNDAELDRLIEARAATVDIGKDTPDADSEMLRAGLERVFLSNAQVRRVLRQLFDLARSHAKSHYSSEDAYLASLYKKFPWGTTTQPAVCLSGLAGVGKSQLLAAFERMLPPCTTIDVTGHANIPLQSAWSMTLRDGMGLNALLAPYTSNEKQDGALEETQGPTKKLKSIGLQPLLGLARRKAWRDGVCLLWVDEFQYVSHGAAANTRATALLLQLLGIGPRLIFSANFSLLHKLMTRNQEDKQRLVSQPIILEPERCSSDEWKALIAEYKNVAPTVFTFDVDRVEHLMHQYTFGIKRLTKELLVCAYREARKKGGSTVGADEIVNAYNSYSYSSNRRDVEVLWRQNIEGRMIKSDLWCPFGKEAQGRSDIDGDATNVAVAQRAIDSFEKKIEDQMLDSALLPEEKEAVKYIEGPKKPVEKSGKVVPMRQKATKESLLNACSLFDEK